MRQGDSLPPFLFVMIVEVLNCLLMEAKNEGIIEGVKVGSNDIDISHLQFANNALNFCPADRENILNIQGILDCFAVMTGLTINYNKSTIIPICCDDDWVADMAEDLRCKRMSLLITYLGIPRCTPEKGIHLEAGCGKK